MVRQPGMLRAQTAVVFLSATRRLHDDYMANGSHRCLAQDPRRQADPTLLCCHVTATHFAQVTNAISTGAQLHHSVARATQTQLQPGRREQRRLAMTGREWQGRPIWIAGNPQGSGSRPVAGGHRGIQARAGRHPEVIGCSDGAERPATDGRRKPHTQWNIATLV